MTRDQAVARFNQGTGFRATGHGQTTFYEAMLREAQRDLEKGKTLPRFLLQEDQTLSLISGTHVVALPTGFLRESDDTLIRVAIAGSDRPRFLKRRYFIPATEAYTDDDNEPGFPSVYVMRKSTIDFIKIADQTYTLTWDYYKADTVLDSNVENAWLAGAAEWLIGEAGMRIAGAQRDKDALTVFESMTQKGRAAVFGEEIVAELASGPLQMGANN